MHPPDSALRETFWQDEFFRFIKPKEYQALGIDPDDIPIGTFPALKHPSQLPSKFGGNAYGFGLFEFQDRLNWDDLRLLQSSFDSPKQIKKHYKKLNDIYRKLGLLTRFSRRGNPYYLIPTHLVSNTLTDIKAKVDKISEIIQSHQQKCLREQQNIGLLTHPDDLIIHELAIRFKEHRFHVLDSREKLRSPDTEMDLIVVTRDLFEIVLLERFTPLSSQGLFKKKLNKYTMHVLWKLYQLLKLEGELLIIADEYPSGTNRTATVQFKTIHEEKSFILFSHIFRTRRKYRIKDHTLEVNVYDFQQFLRGRYIEQEVMDRLLEGRQLDDMTLEELDRLPYINFRLSDAPFLTDQKRSWSTLLPTYFQPVILDSFVPDFVRDEWNRKFFFRDYTPGYMIVFLGEKRPLKITIDQLIDEVQASSLMGCPIELLANYRDSFEFVIRTLRVLERLKKGHYHNLQPMFIDRLRQPLENKNRRFASLNDVTRLMSKINRLENIKSYLNPGNIEGTRTSVMKNLEALNFFGFSHNELKEILFIVLGHTASGRIISGKMSEKALKPVSDLARTYDSQQGLNLLRYCRLMTMAETEAARNRELTQVEITELFDLIESAVRVGTVGDLDWDTLLDEKIIAMGGIHNKIIRKLLKMINHFEFLDNWFELRQKGAMEKDALADYDDKRLSRIENVIRLVNTSEQFEQMYLKADPLQLPAFYRKFLDIEFHGTGRLFERMNSEHVFTLLWITVNLVQGEIINFNPILADVDTEHIEEYLRKVDREAQAINIQYLGHAVLKGFSEQLYHHGSSFIVGTGFQLRVNRRTQALDVDYMDMDKNLERLAGLSRELAGVGISQIPLEKLEELEALFANTESFYQSHLGLLNQAEYRPILPSRQKHWFRKSRELRESLRAELQAVMFRPETLYTDLDVLYRESPSTLGFILPEFTALEALDTSWHVYLDSPFTVYILRSAKKFQVLVNQDTERFQDTAYLHQLARMQFGPMATGIVGMSQAQIEKLEKILERLRKREELFQALVYAVVFQEIGRDPSLREQHRTDINPADFAQAGAVCFEKGGIGRRLQLSQNTQSFIIYLIRNHSLLQHIVRGELALPSLKDALLDIDYDTFDALFVLSVVVLSAMNEGLALEDLVTGLFELRELCHRILQGKENLERHIDRLFSDRGRLSRALTTYQSEGLPEGIAPADYVDSLDRSQPTDLVDGKPIFALERLFRLRGIQYVDFYELVQLMLKVPLKFLHKKRRFSSIGYASFEKQVYEAFRIYNTFQSLAESTRRSILNRLADPELRIFGYEKVAAYLSYENQLKLLLAGLQGIEAQKSDVRELYLNYLPLCQKIEKRYEAVNDYLNTLPMERLWTNKDQIKHFFKAKTGLLLQKDDFPGVISIDFQDHRINIAKKLSYMETIKDVEHLKSYFHYSLRSLRKHPYFTDDYELELESAFEKRLKAITDMLIDQAKEQMDKLEEFSDLYNLANDLLQRSWDIGFTKDQRNRLNDLYELRKDNLKRKKLAEIDETLIRISDIRELNEYWDEVKSYLQTNRSYIGKEFENLVARRFDTALAKLQVP